MNPVRVARYGAAVAGAGMPGFGGYAAVAWPRYGHVDPRRHPRDELLDRFLPDPEVDEYHQVRVRAPAAVTFAAAQQMDIQASPIAKGIFWLRAIPALLRGEPFRPQGSQGIVAETLAQGWGVLAEVPDREIVIGAYTQPWHEHVEFRPLPPEEFAAFREPIRQDRVDAGGRAGRAGRVPVRHPHPRGRHRPALPHEVPPLLRRYRPGSSSSATPACPWSRRKPNGRRPSSAPRRTRRVRDTHNNRRCRRARRDCFSRHGEQGTRCPLRRDVCP